VFQSISKDLSASIKWIVPLLFMAFFSLKVQAQEFPDSYQATYQALDDSTLSFKRMVRLEKHLFKMAEQDKDSLKEYFLPRYEQYIQKLKPEQREAVLESMLIICYQAIGDLALASKYLKDRIELLEGMQDDKRMTVALSQLMFLQVDLDESEEAIATSVSLRDIIRKSTSLEDPDKVFLYRQLGALYQQIGQYELGLEICRKGVNLSQKTEDDSRLPGLYESIALIHEAINSPADSIANNHHRAIRVAIAKEDSFTLRTLFRNMARHQVNIGQADSARYYFKKTFELYADHPYLFGWVADQRAYADFLLGLGDQAEAERVYRNLKGRSKDFINHEPSLKHLIGVGLQIMALRGDLDSFRIYNYKKDSIALNQREGDKLAIREELLVEYEVKEKEAQNQILEAQNESFRIGLLATAILLILLIILIYTRSQKRKTEKALHEKEQKLLASKLRETALEQERSELYNRQLKVELQERVKQLTEHQVLNTELKQIINDLNANLKNPENKKLTRQMKTLVGRKATESALEEIASKIDEFYPGLKESLEERLGKKKEAEIYMSLLYLMDYTTEDIAKLLQKTEKAVRSIRYRVRKKLEMPEELEFKDGIRKLSKELK